MLSIISLIKSYCNFNLDFLFLFCVFSAAGPAFGSAAGSASGLRVAILSKFFIGNNQHLKPLRNFSLVLNNDSKLLKKYFLSSYFVPFSKLGNSLAKLLCLLPTPSIGKCPSIIS